MLASLYHLECLSIAPLPSVPTLLSWQRASRSSPGNRYLIELGLILSKLPCRHTTVRSTWGTLRGARLCSLEGWPGSPKETTASPSSWAALAPPRDASDRHGRDAGASALVVTVVSKFKFILQFRAPWFKKY